ncbi:glycosyltransferase family protein [Lysinibacillus capsici]|uniref:glycosyltransferase family protein n=1 Tax=Lysinibacillus capsici TaxID=2115968 RepID=UPI0028AC3AE6|nr:glycosyltransferase family protein [Lysinibacillus capsici]
MNLAILQARMTSTRLPGKVLKPLNKVEPMLLHQIRRILKSKLIDELIVATSIGKEDDEIVNLCKQNNILYYRGSLDDVLDRFYAVSLQYTPKNIIRLTGDCPLIDPKIIDKVISLHICNENDYTSNVIIPTYPDGMDVEVLTYETLIKIKKSASRPSHKEHVTLYLNENREKFKTENVTYNKDLSEIRLTVDEYEDLELIQKVYNKLQNKGDYTLEDIIILFKNEPELLNINKQFNRNEGLVKSLENEGRC